MAKTTTRKKYIALVGFDYTDRNGTEHRVEAGESVTLSGKLARDLGPSVIKEA